MTEYNVVQEIPLDVRMDARDKYGNPPCPACGEMPTLMRTDYHELQFVGSNRRLMNAVGYTLECDRGHKWSRPL